MSWCGCIGHSAPATIRSSLNTRSAPTPSCSGSRYRSNEKCQRASNQPPCSCQIVSASRIATVLLEVVMGLLLDLDDPGLPRAVPIGGDEVRLDVRRETVADLGRDVRELDRGRVDVPRIPGVH